VAINGIAIKVLKKNGKKEEKETGDGREKRARDNAIVIPESPCDKLSVVIKTIWQSLSDRCGTTG